MIPRSSRLAALPTIFFALALLSMTGAPRAGAIPRATQAAKTILFIVSSPVAGQASILPIMIIDGGNYKAPVAGDSDAEEISRFAADYYRKGQEYRVLFGGGSAGKLTVKNSTKDLECERTSAAVALQTPQVRFNSNVMALATNSDSLGTAKGSRRAPTNAERAAVMPLALAAFRQKGVAASLLPSMDTVNLTATDLNGDGKAELIGSFVVKKTKGGQERFVLFLLAEPDGNAYKPALSNYERFTQKDMMSGASIDAIGQTGVYTERLVDHLDLDADGTSEVVTMKLGLEGDGYTIYRKQQGRWQTLYEFSNYRCAF
ncbi:MAG TPA: hypothetical protein VF735_20450 [Pyrinomonadaceae bacterium]|jgi:hypothetical protein